MKLLFVLLALLSAGNLSARSNQETFPGGTNMSEADSLGNGLFALISTDRGDMVLQLYPQKAPLTVCNFVALAEGKMTNTLGKPFFDGLTFHRVISRVNGDDQDFMIQGGDPLGNGTGGPGYQFPDEFNNGLTFDGPGVLAMANSGANTNGSQFFITIVATPWLNNRHTIFGQVVEGQAVVNSIRSGEKMNKVSIIRNGPSAQAYVADQAAFDALLQEQAEKDAAAARAKREADFAEIVQKYPNLLEGPSNLRYEILKPGSGEKLSLGQVVEIRYRASFADGRVFDSSDLSGGPIPMRIGALLPGLDLSLRDMQIGEKRLVVIPPELAYGESGLIQNGIKLVPANSYLVFELETMRIVK
jgi:peptidylprolyl isomerase